jgi:hypothetical protein
VAAVLLSPPVRGNAAIGDAGVVQSTPAYRSFA